MWNFLNCSKKIVTPGLKTFQTNWFVAKIHLIDYEYMLKSIVGARSSILN
jgi:hypothetical protein